MIRSCPLRQQTPTILYPAGIYLIWPRCKNCVSRLTMIASYPVPDLYIAPSSRPLLLSFAAALLDANPAEIVYMNDFAPLPESVMAALQQRFPEISLSIRTDRDCVKAFATLPGWFPALLRRNLAPRRGNWLAGPADSPPDWMRPRYRKAVIYVTGPFLTKTLQNRCYSIILREDGLGNYHPRRVGWGKAILRAMAGLPPRQHFMGEEKWVSRIELARPGDLPLRLRHKAGQLTLTNLLNALPPATCRSLIGAFWSGPAFAPSGPAALVVQQPLAALGITTEAEEKTIYSALTERLRQKGYDVYIKRHPQDDDPACYDRHEIPRFFPIEAWPWLYSRRFTVAVAVCSAALDIDSPEFSAARIQLTRPEAFTRGDLSGWESALESGLTALGSH